MLVVAVGPLQVRLQLGERGDDRRRGAVRVAALERHRAVGHAPEQVDAQPDRALGDVADLAAFRLAADRAVDPLAAAAGHEVPGAEHHPLLVDQRGDDDPARERSGADDGVGGEQHRRNAGLHVGRAAAPDLAVAELGAERIDRPRRQVALGDHVGVALEHERAAGRVALDGGDHIGPAVGDGVEARLPPERPHLGLDELGRRRLAQAALRVEHARDAHELARELDERIGVDRGHRRRHQPDSRAVVRRVPATRSAS